MLAAAKKLATLFAGLRVKLDDRDEKSPGFKFNEWEVKGVPVRIELGPKDLEKKAVMLCRRDTGEKTSVAMASCTTAAMQAILDEIQGSLYEQAKKYMEDHTTEADSYDALQKVIDADGGFVWAPWDGTLKTANAIKDKTKATIRLLGDASKAKGKKDLVSGDAAQEWALFAKAY